MHVLVIPAWYDISDPISGIFFHEYCNALASKVRVTLLSIKFHSFSERFRKKQKMDRVGEKKYELLQIDYYSPLPGLPPDFLKQRMKNLVNKKISRQNGQAKWDVLHIQSVCNNITPWISEMISEKYKIPYVITEHYTSFKEAGEAIFNPFTSAKEVQDIVKKASKRFGVSDHACRYYKEIFGCEFETVYNIIPNELVDTPVSAPPASDFSYTCIGNLQSRKGQTMIIEAFKLLSKEINNIKLTVVGEGADKEKLKDLVKEYGIGNRVAFINNVPKNEILKIIDRSDVIISASENETFGLTLAEALVRGKPVVSTKSGGPEEFVNEKNGILINKGDINALADSMKRMYSDHGKYNSDAIRKEAIEKFSESAIVPLMISKYEEVLKGLN
jgi:L-malate glycosyltransferase